jgi:hypothetical protein
MANQLVLCSLLSFVVHLPAASDSHDERNWAEDFTEWVPTWLKDLDFDPESWSEKLGLPEWQKELQTKICTGVDGAQIDGANCGRGAFEREKTRLLEKLDVEQVAKLDLKAQLKTCELRAAGLQDQTSLRRQWDLTKQELETLREERYAMTHELLGVQASQERTAALSCCLLAIALGLLYAGVHLQKKADAHKAEADEVTKELQSVKKDFEHEFGGMLTLSDFSENLGEEFSFHISDEMRDRGKVRTVKVQCPGVSEKDVFMVIVSNGCEVTIDRKASCGVEAVTWKKRFQFRPSEGAFEFKRDEAVLENGYLTIAFDVGVFQEQVFRLPSSRHPISDSKGSNQDSTQMHQTGASEAYVPSAEYVASYNGFNYIAWPPVVRGAEVVEVTGPQTLPIGWDTVCTADPDMEGIVKAVIKLNGWGTQVVGIEDPDKVRFALYYTKNDSKEGVEQLNANVLPWTNRPSSIDFKYRRTRLLLRQQQTEEQQKKDIPVDARITSLLQPPDTDEPNEGCALSGATQTFAEDAHATQMEQDLLYPHLNMFSESSDMPAEEDEQENDPSDTSSNSTLDGFEHVEHIQDIQ